MHKIISLAFSLLLLSQSACAQTQAEMNISVCGRYQQSNKVMQDVYKQVSKRYKKDSLFQNALKASQLAWLKYRDASLRAAYPNMDDNHYYGSIFPVCRCNFLRDMTEQRINHLKQWLKPHVEGDVCTIGGTES